MTITATGAVQPVFEPSAARRPAAADAGFMVPSAAAEIGDEMSAASREVSAPLDAGAMLALQEEAGWDLHHLHQQADRDARRHGKDVLEALAALQRELLADGDLQASLARLAALLDTPSDPHDPALARVLAAIRLRAGLEMLRLAPSTDTGADPAARDA